MTVLLNSASRWRVASIDNKSARTKRTYYRRCGFASACLREGGVCMQQTTKIIPRSPRAKLSQSVRVRPYDPHDPEEVCVTQNLSRMGFYFETSLGHYFSGMSVGLTRNFAPGDPVNREERGEVVRVERLKNGNWGVAIRILISSPAW
jgi:hypothetical protein